MATLKKYDLTGKEKDEVVIADELLATRANAQMVKDYIVALRANRRQWSASTQTRAEVSHSKKKPFAQKGTGNARQGFLGSPQFRGGGRAHGPRPKFDQKIRVNQKERRLAIKSQLCEVVRESCACVLDCQVLEAPSTKALAHFLRALKFENTRVLFLGNCDCLFLSKSLRNLPKAQFTHLPNVNGYDLALCEKIVIVDSVVDDFKEILGEKQS